MAGDHPWVIQGISELFPISSLGHTVILPSIFGWHSVVVAESQPESFWLAFVVMLHVGSAIGLLIYFWRDWIRIIRAWFHSLFTRSISTSTERLAWLIAIASIPAGVIGIAQLAALIAGISRDGICMGAGLARGLDHEDSAKFAFLLATPIILAAGVFKLSDLTGPLGAGIRSQALVAALCAAVTAVFSVAFLMRYFKTKNLRPFGICCLLFGPGTLISAAA